MKGSADKAAGWVGKDALKELEKLTAVEGRTRLIASDSKMGQEKLARPSGGRAGER